MRTDDLKIALKKYLHKVDWDLLIFLLLFMNVKLVLKLSGLVFIYLRRRNFSFRFSFTSKGLTFFYPAILLIAILNYVIAGLYKEHNYIYLLLTGTGFWILCILSLHQVYLSVTKGRPEKIHQALFLFFMINAAVSFGNLLAIILETGAGNPYRYQGLYQKYFISTGDYIRGISFDTSTTNALLNSFGVVYFLVRGKILPVWVCMVVLLLCCSNFTNFLMIACMVFLFVFRSGKNAKSVIVINMALLVIFMTNISPSNNEYSNHIFEKAFLRKTIVVKKNIPDIPVTQKPDSVLSHEEKRIKIAKLYLDSVALQQTAAAGQSALFAPVIPKENIHAPDHQYKKDTSEARLQAILFMERLKQKNKPVQKDSVSILNPTIGKLAAYKQLWDFMKDHPSRLIAGNGMGNFSSKLAFRATGLKIAGGYPAAYIYIGTDFADNHLSVYLNYYGKDSGYHSIVNSPNSTYAQLLGEYGLLGIAGFLFLYLRYFAVPFKKLTYGLPVLLIMLGAFAVDYWFEQLSVVILFELLMLLDTHAARGEERSV